MQDALQLLGANSCLVANDLREEWGRMEHSEC